MEAEGSHSSPGLSYAGNVCPQGVGPGQGAEEVQVRGIEEAHSAISTATEDVVLAHRDAVGHSGLQAEELRSARATCHLLLTVPCPEERSVKGGVREKQPGALA